MKVRSCALIAAVFVLLIPPLPAQDSSASLSSELEVFFSGIYAPETGPSLGSAAELSLHFEGEKGQARSRASFRLALLQGIKARALWASLLALPDGSLGLLTAPAFDPGASVPDWLALCSLDELTLSWSGGAFAAEAGMGFANWGLGKAFSPADFFSEIDVSSATPRRKPSFLGRLSWFPGELWRFDLVASPEGPPGIGGNRGPLAAARVYGLAGENLLLAASLGYKDPDDASPRFLGALEASLDLGRLTPYLEAALSAPSQGILEGRLEDAEARLLAGLSAIFTRAAFSAEYLYSPASSEVHRLFGTAAFSPDEWNRLGASALVSLASGSGTASLGFESDALPGLSIGIWGSAARSTSQTWSLSLSASARSRL